MRLLILTMLLFMAFNTATARDCTGFVEFGYCTYENVTASKFVSCYQVNWDVHTKFLATIHEMVNANKFVTFNTTAVSFATAVENVKGFYVKWSVINCVPNFVTKTTDCDVINDGIEFGELDDKFDYQITYLQDFLAILSAKGVTNEQANAHLSAVASGLFVLPTKNIKNQYIDGVLLRNNQYYLEIPGLGLFNNESGIHMTKATMVISSAFMLPSPPPITNDCSGTVNIGQPIHP